MAHSYCHSCTAPLDVPELRSAAKDYCKHCTDADGSLLPKKEVLDGIAGWFKSWQGKISDEVARKRAAHFMKAMPAWALGANGNGTGARRGSQRSKAPASRRTKATRGPRAQKGPKAGGRRSAKA